MIKRLVQGAAVALALVSPAQAQQWSGQVALEWRGFFQTPLFPHQPRASVSLMLMPELYLEWGDQSLLVTPYARLDQTDPERTHADLRELQWQHAATSWELRLGVGKVFWGVTESQHLVDIINQIDFVENIDGEDRLGQPMVNLALIRPWGAVDLFVLPGFRTRTFSGPDGRLRFPLRIATELAQFESAAAQQHVDFAARWSHTLGDADLGVAHFHGSRPGPAGRVYVRRTRRPRPVAVRG